MKINNWSMLIIGLINWVIIVILLAGVYLLNGCKAPEPETEYITLPPVIEEPEIPIIDDPVIPDEPEPEPLEDVKYLTYDGTDVKFVYENGSEVWKSGKVNYIEPGVFSVEDIIYFLDITGNVLQSYRLPCVPDAVALNGADVWSAAIDGSVTFIYLNSDLLSVYPWIIDRINVTYTGDVIAYTTGRKFVPLEGDETDIKYAADGGLFVFDLDTTDKTASFRGMYDYHDGWFTNYFWRATGWLLANDLWISSNGYTWDAGGLNEAANSMHTWNLYPYPVQDIYNESPIIIPAAVRTEHGEEVTYWIECNTGYLIRHTTSIDLLEVMPRLYTGDGLRATGFSLQYSLKPSVIADRLYYHHGGFLYEYDFTTETITNIGTDMQIWGVE